MGWKQAFVTAFAARIASVRYWPDYLYLLKRQ